MDAAQAAMAKRMINAAICTYQIHPADWVPAGFTPLQLETVWSFDRSYFYNVVPMYQDAVGFAQTAEQGYVPGFTCDGQDDINAGLVGMMADGNLLIAIRGTIPPTFDNGDFWNWVDDWTQDAEIWPMAWNVAGKQWSNVNQVETGFGTAMLDLWRRLGPMIAAILNDKTVNCTGICITGHSKGAAMTYLCATLVAQVFPAFADKIQVHAFAAPAAVNLNFAKQYAPLAATTHRYQVEYDLVPFLPLWSDANLFHELDVLDPFWAPIWNQLMSDAEDATGGGYESPGDFTYFLGNHQQVPGAKVDTSALPTIGKAVLAEDWSTIAAAHSAVDSYLPCFP